MPKGYNGKILRVNLTDRVINIEEPNETVYRRYLGGRALALYYLLREIDAGVDAFDPSNKIVFATSVVTGAPIPGTSRYSIVSKSPLTSAYGESEAGGFFGPELKFAGFDAIIIEGKASKPVYLWIHDGEAEIRDGERIWGKDTGEAQKIIRAEVREERARVAIIGQAGENLVRFACVLNELKHANGRCGMGAVMGSKNLKAIAVRGHNGIELANPDGVKAIARFFADNFRDNADTSQLNKFGTSQYFLNCNDAGTLPARNFSAGSIGPTGADHLQHEHDGAFDPLLTGYSHKADEPGLFSEQAYPLGILEPVESLSIGPKKVQLFTYLQHWWSLFNCLEICIFTFAPVRVYRAPQIVDIVNAVTGWETSLWELMKVGERATTMARAFNIKHGLTKEDDRLAGRTYEPLSEGVMKGNKVPKEEFLKAIPMYYEMMGWDRNSGIPTYGKLAELGIPWVADEISTH